MTRRERGEVHQHLEGSVNTVTKHVEGLLELVERKSVCDQGSEIDSTFSDPLHGEGEGAFKVRVQAGDNLGIFPEGRAEADPVDGMRQDTKDQNSSLGPHQFNCIIHSMGPMSDRFNDNFGEVTVEDFVNSLQ
jgi:hypothetical protein